MTTAAPAPIEDTASWGGIRTPSDRFCTGSQTITREEHERRWNATYGTQRREDGSDE